MDEARTSHRGGCHCGAVRFTIQAPADVTVFECNCSICRMTGFQHLFVPQEHFQLIAGADDLAEYRFNSGAARHLFCRHCGIKSFYVPRSHPDGYSVNLRCLDRESLGEVRIEPFDGANWEKNIADLPPLPET
jgi:hypothetical protein